MYITGWVVLVILPYHAHLNNKTGSYYVFSYTIIICQVVHFDCLYMVGSVRQLWWTESYLACL